jgi:hypothetical protein
MMRLLAAIAAAVLLAPAIAMSQAPGRVLQTFDPTARGAQVEVSGTSLLVLDVAGPVAGASAASLTVTPVRGGEEILLGPGRAR